MGNSPGEKITGPNEAENHPSCSRSIEQRRYKCVFLGLMTLFMAFVLARPSHAQEFFQLIRLSSSPNPVGSGARAQGMGGAFIAVADDATAASWNPGGLIQLETPELSVVGSYARREEEFSSRDHPEAETTGTTDSVDLNYLSAAYPFTLWGRNMVVSLNFQRLFEFDKDIRFNFASSGELADGSPFSVNQEVDLHQSGGLKALAPAYAVQLTPTLSLGLTLNIWTGELGYDNGWEERITSISRGLVGDTLVETHLEQFNRFSNFSGVNANFGFLWDITPMITVGGVFKAPFRAHVEREFTIKSRQFIPSLGREFSQTLRGQEDVKMDMPMSYGLGVALRLSDAFTVSLDITRTEWSDALLINEEGEKTSLVDGLPEEESDVDATHQVRAGMEYLFILPKTVIPVRAGVFYDPEPAHGSPEDFYGFSLGTGVIIGRFVLDAAYVFRWGNGVEGIVQGIPNTTADVRQHRFLASAIIHF
ncbi:MAG: outer membrane protein transport protein [Deltaproteobacteria bacterium]|nr:outer membrane protein transport protein [Deltaproteobacteria bacterium]MBW2308676.1 outer membrane protein transport protein [Deltaproteobacteria bacterium]